MTPGRQALARFLATTGALAAELPLLAACASGPAVPPFRAAAPVPSFGSYKDVTQDRAPGDPTLRVSLGGPLRALLAAMPASQASVSWAFATGPCGEETWGGLPGAAFAAANVPAFVAAGKHYVVSTGGQGGTFTCATDEGFERFLARYRSPSFEGIDFDIEAGQTPDDVDRLVALSVRAQRRHPGLRISFTLATLGGDRPQALAPLGVAVMQALRRHRMDTAIVNLMVMDYGPPEPANCAVGADGRCDMGRSALHAAQRLHDDWGVDWKRIELTPMIGGNDSVDETFTLQDVDVVTAFARDRGLAGLRFWSMDRDADCPPGPASPRCNTVGGAGPWGYTRRFLAGLGR